MELEEEDDALEVDVIVLAGTEIKDGVVLDGSVPCTSCCRFWIG